MHDCKICACQLTQPCQVCRFMCLQLVCLVTITLGPGLVGSLSSQQTQVPDRLSLDQNSAQIRFRLSPDHLRLSLSPDLDQIQNKFSSGSAQISFTLSSDQVQRSSGSDLDQVYAHLSSNQVQPSSGSDSGPSRFSSDQVQTQLIAYSSQIRFRLSSD